jgi:hypothetical protein
VLGAGFPGTGTTSSFCSSRMVPQQSGHSFVEGFAIAVPGAPDLWGAAFRRGSSSIAKVGLPVEAGVEASAPVRTVRNRRPLP